jgi:serine/threonine-protein kinase
MITPAGAVKVMDFGIARALSDAQPAVTQTAAVIGTAQYLSPEQARGEPVDARSDVYAAGCVLFELLTGRPPFTGDSPVAIAYQHVREDAPAPSTIRPSVSPELDAITMKALSKNPANRYQSADEMREDLYRVLEGQRPSAPMVMTAADRTDMMTGGTPVAPSAEVDEFARWQAEQEQARRARGRRNLGILLAVVLLLAAAAGSYFLFSPSVRTVAVPTVTGQPQNVALQTLATAGLRPTVVAVASPAEQVGQVVTTSPGPGSEVPRDSLVELRVGRGPDRIQVPSVVGQTAVEAQASLQRLGLSLAPVPQQREVDDPGQVGRVLAQDPAAGQFLAPGTPVLLTLGRQRETLRLPDVVGQDRQTAETTLEGVGLRVTVTEVDGGGQPGTVVDTSPAAGATVPRNSPVTLEVTRGNRLTVPSVVGQIPSEAAPCPRRASRGRSPRPRSRPATPRTTARSSVSRRRRAARRTPAPRSRSWSAPRPPAGTVAVGTRVAVGSSGSSPAATSESDPVSGRRGGGEGERADPVGEAADQVLVHRVAAGRHPGREHPVSVLGEHRLGVELHTLERQLAVAHGHQHAVVGPAGGFEGRRQGVRAHRQRVVAGGRERAGESGQDADPLVVDQGGLAVAQLRGALDDGPVDRAEGLVTQADPEHRPADRGAAADDRGAGARVLGRPGTGTDQHAVDLVDEIDQAVDVVAPHHRLRAELGEVLDEVVDEAVVVVDDEDPHRPSVRRDTVGPAPRQQSPDRSHPCRSPRSAASRCTPRRPRPGPLRPGRRTRPTSPSCSVSACSGWPGWS